MYITIQCFPRPPPGTNIGCSYISRQPNELSDCCVHPWELLPASLVATDACPSGHNVQGFGVKHEGNINQTADHSVLVSQDHNVSHSPYVIHKIPVFFGNEVVIDLVI